MNANISKSVFLYCCERVEPRNGGVNSRLATWVPGSARACWMVLSSLATTLLLTFRCHTYVPQEDEATEEAEEEEPKAEAPKKRTTRSQRAN